MVTRPVWPSKPRDPNGEGVRYEFVDQVWFKLLLRLSGRGREVSSNRDVIRWPRMRPTAGEVHDPVPRLAAARYGPPIDFYPMRGTMFGNHHVVPCRSTDFRTYRGRSAGQWDQAR